jgi:hypothetical protein
VLDYHLPSRWRAALADRDKWTIVANEFRERHSVEETSGALGIAPERISYLLDFLCTELCGCRRVTCASCLDDYRNQL